MTNDPTAAPRPLDSILPSIVAGKARDRVQARFSDGRIFEASPGTPLVAVLRVAGREGDLPALAAVVDGRLRELWTPLSRDSEVEPVTHEHSDGVRVYRRSVVFLLVTAAAEIFPDAEIFIEHSPTTAAGYFCDVRNRAAFSQEDLGRIEARMREMVAVDAPIEKVRISVKEAMALFRSRREVDKARLLAYRQKETVPMYSLCGRLDRFHGYMAPSAGCLTHFALRASPPGFLLAFPHQGRMREMPPPPPYPKLFEVFDEAGRWLDRIGIRSVGALSDAIAQGRHAEISLVAEALHGARLAEIARQIVANENVRIVLVAGPSSSGKTTFARRLAVQLLTHGRRSFALSLDDYFVDRASTPKDSEGKPDYESLGALDVTAVSRNLLELTAGKTVELPHYNFHTGQREKGIAACLGLGDIVIVEGIHGLNPDLLHDVPGERIFRVYVSALTQLNLDRHNRVSTADSRLIRRMVRDAAQRGYSAAATLERWPAVLRGEKQHIFPYQENADSIFNASLMHELAVLRPFAEPLLLQIRPESPVFVEANRILSFLQLFPSTPPRHVPDNSILREFIGGSILEDFALWPLPAEHERT
jgi:uridine kinase